MKASIIVITRNRAAYLHEALKTLIAQEIQGEAYEIIVVDNNSKDATASVVKDFKRAFGDKIQYVFEPEAGMSRARNKGADKAKGEVLLFIDDDALASPHWLQNHCSLYEVFPNLVATGGRIELLFDSGRPNWLADELLIVLGHLNYSDEESLMFYPDHPFGVNFSVKKNHFIKIGGFEERVRNYNDEKTFFYKLLLNKCNVGYSPKALVYHRIPTSRLRKVFFIKRGFKQGMANIRFHSICDPSGVPQFQREFNQLISEGLIILRNILLYENKCSFAQIYYLCIRWGQILGIMMRSVAKNEYRSHNQKNEASQPSFRI
jgi:glucosyl-dolichyl phosphate glucuronosyltransferase